MRCLCYNIKMRYNRDIMGVFCPFFKKAAEKLPKSPHLPKNSFISINGARGDSENL